MNRHFEREECFLMVSCKVLREFLTKAKTLIFVVVPIIIIPMPIVATHRVKVEQIILFMKIVNFHFHFLNQRYFESNCFLARQFRS